MSVRLPKSFVSSSKWHSIDLSGGQILEIEVRRPTFEEQVAALAANTHVGYQRARLTSMIISWRGVVDDAGQDLAYSWQNLEALMSVYPQSLRHILTAVNDAWVTLPEDLEKNSPAPPANGGTTTNDATTDSTTSSPCGPSSATEPVREPSLAPS